MPAKRPCLDCKRPILTGPRCPDCARAHDAARGSSAARGYGGAHQAVRRRLLVAWGRAQARGQVWHCPRCGGPLVAGQPVDADHYEVALRDDPSAVADRLSHRGCNRGDRSWLARDGGQDAL